MSRKRSQVFYFSMSMTCLVIALITSGCSPETKHKVVNFFFTGVPSLEEQEKAKEPQAPKPDLATLVREKRALLYKPPKFFVHGPYSSGECGRCHAVGASRKFRTTKTQATQNTIPQSAGVGARLSAPVEKLCISCHTVFSGTSMTSRRLQAHTPVAEGKCTQCHSPHQSTQQYMLLAESKQALCARCHESNALKTVTAHGKIGPAGCIACHNPHMGKTASLLRSDYDELLQNYNGE